MIVYNICKYEKYVCIVNMKYAVVWKSISLGPHCSTACFMLTSLVLPFVIKATVSFWSQSYQWAVVKQERKKRIENKLALVK